MLLSYRHIKISIQEKWVLEPNYTIQHVLAGKAKLGEKNGSKEQSASLGISAEQ